MKSHQQERIHHQGHKSSCVHVTSQIWSTVQPPWTGPALQPSVDTPSDWDVEKLEARWTPLALCCVQAMRQQFFIGVVGCIVLSAVNVIHVYECCGWSMYLVSLLVQVLMWRRRRSSVFPQGQSASMVNTWATEAWPSTTATLRLWRGGRSSGTCIASWSISSGESQRGTLCLSCSLQDKPQLL